MNTFGTTTFMIGLGQAMFQVYMLLTGSYWPKFTVGDFMIEFGSYGDYGYTLWGQMVQRLFGMELSFTLMALGVMVVLSGPVAQVVRTWQEHRVIRQSSHRPSYLPQRRMH